MKTVPIGLRAEAKAREGQIPDAVGKLTFRENSQGSARDSAALYMYSHITYSLKAERRSYPFVTLSVRRDSAG